MGTWSIKLKNGSGAGGATISSEGVAKFPSNTTHNDIVYVIGYQDSTDCPIFTTEHTVKGKSSTCTCNSVTVSPTSWTWSYDEYDESVNTLFELEAVGSCSFSNVSYNTTAAENAGFHCELDAEDSTKLYVWPNEMNTSSSPKTANVIVSFKVNGSSCTKTISLEQEGSEESNVYLEVTTIYENDIIPASGCQCNGYDGCVTVRFWGIKPDGTHDRATIQYAPSNAIDTTCNGGEDWQTVTIIPNTSPYDLGITITAIYNGESKSITLTQKGNNS